MYWKRLNTLVEGSGYYVYQNVKGTEILPLVHTVYLCLIWISEQTVILRHVRKIAASDY